MTIHEHATAFAKEAEKNERIRELARKSDTSEGLTDAETDEFIRLIERVEYPFNFLNPLK